LLAPSKEEEEEEKRRIFFYILDTDLFLVEQKKIAKPKKDFGG
jgi:ferritin